VLYTVSLHPGYVLIKFLNICELKLLSRKGVINFLSSFQYIDPPEERMILEALKQLYFFGALDR